MCYNKLYQISHSFLWPLAGQWVEFRSRAEWRRRSQLSDASLHASINTGWYFTHIQISASMEVRSLSAGLTRLNWKIPAAPPRSEFLYLNHWDLLSSRRGALSLSLSAGSSLLLDSCANRQNIPPLHDLDVIVWLGGVVPTTGCTAAAGSGLRGGRVAFNPRTKTTQHPVQLITADWTSACGATQASDPDGLTLTCSPSQSWDITIPYTVYIWCYYRIHGAWPIFVDRYS